MSMKIATPQTWRNLLGNLIENRGDRQRLADVSGLREETLQRWAHLEADPRPATLQALLAAVPEHRSRLLELILVEFPSFTYSVQSEDVFPRRRAGSYPRKGIPPAFYDRVLYTYATTLDGLRFWTMCNLVLQQALIQLDPERLGMSISVAQCMPTAAGERVHCLWERVEVGTPPWRGDLAQKNVFLGVESLAGYAAVSRYPAVIQDLATNPDHLPVRQRAHRESVAAFPLLMAGSLAGCLIVSSSEKNFFSPARCDLVESYTRLLLLAFHGEPLYGQEAIDFAIMPDDRVQRAHMATFRGRVNERLLEAAWRGSALTCMQAELQVRQLVVEEFMRLAQQPAAGSDSPVFEDPEL
jgi:GAF domain